jgi:hypothetical protein
MEVQMADLTETIRLLNMRMETLRTALIDEFRSADEVPQAIKDSYLAAALCGIELEEPFGDCPVHAHTERTTSKAMTQRRPAHAG